MSVKRENWGGRYVLVDRASNGRIQSWRKWTGKDRGTTGGYRLSRRLEERGLIPPAKGRGAPTGELNEYLFKIEVEDAPRDRSNRGIISVRYRTDEELDRNEMLVKLVKHFEETGQESRADYLTSFLKSFQIHANKGGSARLVEEFENLGRTTSTRKGWNVEDWGL